MNSPLLTVSAVSAITIASSLALISASSSPREISASDSTTVCVRTKTKAIAMPVKGKCKRGWRLKALGVAGPQGPQGVPGPAGSTGQAGQRGPAGPEHEVKDASGAVVGTFAGYQSLGQNPLISVQRSDGAYTYNAGGRLQPEGNVFFQSANCTGDAYAVSNIALVDDLLSAVGSQGRAVVRQTIPTYGPPRVFRLTSTWTGHQASYYKPTSTGGCEFIGNLTLAFVEYEPVTAPPDYVGPLSVS